MKKIEYTVNGFMKDPAYTFYFPSVFEEFEDKFGEAESIDVELDEIPYTWIGKKQKEPITFSEDGKKITIYYSNWKNYDNKGKFISNPTPKSVFDSLDFLMRRAVKEYAEKFPPEETEPEQEQE